MLTLADAAALLVLLVLLHRTGAFLSQITRLPTITICLVAGTVCHTCGVFTEQTASGILSLHHAALAVITFAAGSELELEALRANFAVVRSVTLGLTVAALLVVFVLSLPLLVACSASSLMLCTSTEVSHGTVAAMLAAVVAVARSPSSAIGVVRELQADGPFTQTMLTVTMVTDVAVIVLFTGAIEIADAALDPSGLNGAANGVAITARFVSRTAVHLVLSLGHGALLAALCLCVLALPAASMLRPLALYMVGGFAFLAERGMHHMLHGMLHTTLHLT
jgi:Kef-type K+ transport system membrane component KefB